MISFPPPSFSPVTQLHQARVHIRKTNFLDAQQETGITVPFSIEARSYSTQVYLNKDILIGS